MKLCSRIILWLSIILIAIEGTFGPNLKHSLLFVVTGIISVAGLLFGLYKAIRSHRFRPYALAHLGLAAIITGGLCGASSFREETIAVSPEGYAGTGLPFSIRLESFTTEFHKDSDLPRQYTSRIDVDGTILTTSVNHPCFHKGWMIYQSGFDGTRPDIPILKFVRNPWAPAVFAGILLLALGSALMIPGIRGFRQVTDGVLALAAIFTVSSIVRINMGALPPALRSFWFIPHLAFYMIAYSALAIALPLGIISIRREGRAGELAGRMLDASSSLLALGMICGAIWAEAVWGNWWRWDAKECWAAVTWLTTLLPRHYSGAHHKEKIFRTIMIALAFLCMQMTWYGVDFLPAARGSLHTYLN